MRYAMGAALYAPKMRRGIFVAIPRHAVAQVSYLDGIACEAAPVLIFKLNFNDSSKSKCALKNNTTAGAFTAMSRRILRPQRDVCQLCGLMRARNSLPTKADQSRQPFNIRPVSTPYRNLAQRSPSSRLPTIAAKAIGRSTETPKTQYVVSQEELENGLEKLRSISDKLFAYDRVLSEAETVLALNYCKDLATNLVPESSPSSQVRKDGAASLLLSLDESSKTKRILLHKLSQPARRMADELANIAFSIVKHPTVFITPKVLKVYTDVQSRLGKPETFPAVFDMYANKPLPLEASSPVKFKQQNPNRVANAIPLTLASHALDTAIDARQLVVAMDIIDSTYTKPAFLRAKLIRQGLLPVSTLAISPFAAWVVASKLAHLQTTMDPTMATNVAFAGILAYVGFTAVIGVVAMSTANDQMDRVTWAPGIPLRERWLREDERAAIDRIAGAWGFRETWRRGEEEGEDWDALQEWIGSRGLILDRVSLMEGME